MRRLGSLCVWFTLVLGFLAAIAPGVSDRGPSAGAPRQAEHSRRCSICRASGPRLPDEIDGDNVRLVGHRGGAH